jgi:acyl-CoA dehydrogenase
MSDERSALRELIAELAAAVPGTTATGELPAAWGTIRELGLDSIGVTEDSGGSGGTLAHLAVIVDAIGEAGMGLPLIEVATARWILALAGVSMDTALPIVVLTDDASQPLVLRGVPWARSADLLIVYSKCGAPRAYELGTQAVKLAGDTNLAGEQCDTINISDTSSLELVGAPSADAVRARLGLLWAAALTGAVRGAYDKTRDHVRTREQFGAPLIKIPAVASALANFRTQLLLAETAVARAVDGLRCSDEYADTNSVASARIVAASSATEAARLAHQLHGAMGVTHEDGLHRLTTRLWAWQDAVTSEREWSNLLGETAIDSGEDFVWSELTPAF